MNFGKLLGVGKSFFGSDPMAAYRLNKRACLPKFNDGKNPFAAKAAEMAAVVAPGKMAEPASEAPQAEKKALNGSGLTIAQAVAMAQETRARKAQIPYASKSMARQSIKPATAPVAPSVTKPARVGWTTKLNPFRPAAPVVASIAEQTELSLDSVKVVHNDLADADVEVVPVKSHSAPEPAMLPPARQAWEYLGENLLKSS